MEHQRSKEVLMHYSNNGRIGLVKWGDGYYTLMIDHQSFTLTDDELRMIKNWEE